MKTIRSLRNIRKYLLFIVLSVLGLFFLAPFVWGVFATFKTNQDIVAIPLMFFPKEFHFNNYVEMAKTVDLERSFLNSFIVSAAITISVLFTSTITAYVFAKHRFPGKNFLFFAILASMMLPLYVKLIPQYLIISRLGFTDNYLGMIVPYLSIPYGIFLVRQYMSGIPNSFIDSARIDGAKEMTIYSRIIIPQCAPIISALAIFTFMQQWNNFLWPLVVVGSRKLFTLTLMLGMLSSRIGVEYNIILSGAVVSIIPTIIVYIIFQRQFVQGITMTGIKG
jgi:multiple sugar transport system permease protein